MRSNRFVVLVAVVAMGVVVGGLGLGASYGDDDGGGEQADHMLLDREEDGEGVGYCGVAKKAEPWTLHIATTTRPLLGPGVLGIEFRDEASTAFNVPGGDSIGLTESFGGVPGTDDLVRLTFSAPNDGLSDALISALAKPGARDPFTEDGPQEKDNFCVNVAAEGPVSTSLSVPDSWVEDGDGSDGGTLQ